MFMFAVAGVIWTKMLHPDKDFKYLGIPNRWAVAIGGTVFSVFVEYLLNSVNALTWDYAWWNRGAPWLILIFGYLWFFVFAFWVYDMPDFKQKLRVVGTIWAVDIVGLIVFAGFLKWI